MGKKKGGLIGIFDAHVVMFHLMEKMGTEAPLRLQEKENEENNE